MKFTAPNGLSVWDSEYDQDVLKNALESYPEEIATLEKAIEDNISIKELIELFPGDIEIIIGFNCSGVDIANLSEETITEYTW